MRKNIEFCAEWRKKCGPDFPLMLDCYMALDAKCVCFPLNRACGRVCARVRGLPPCNIATLPCVHTRTPCDPRVGAGMLETPLCARARMREGSTRREAAPPG